MKEIYSSLAVSEILRFRKTYCYFYIRINISFLKLFLLFREQTLREQQKLKEREKEREERERHRNGYIIRGYCDKGILVVIVLNYWSMSLSEEGIG